MERRVHANHMDAARSPQEFERCLQRYIRAQRVSFEDENMLLRSRSLAVIWPRTHPTPVLPIQGLRLAKDHVNSQQNGTSCVQYHAAMMAPQVRLMRGVPTEGRT